jgi:4-amino-4-deoxy-L-arabinose transferase-like glycosyltransferase
MRQFGRKHPSHVVTESIAFFSVSMGKRPVYILPIYPALSLLMAVWFFQHNAAAGTRRVLYRLMAAFAGAAGLILIVITMGALWRHDPSWFFSPVEPRHTELSAARAEVWTLDTHLDRPSVALTDWLRNLWVLHTVVSYQ